MDSRSLLSARARLRKNRYCPHDPFGTQQAFLKLDCLEALFGGAAGGGKSDALLMAGLQYVHVPGYAALLLRRTYPDLALPGAIMDRSHEWLARTDARWDGTDKTWHFPAGSTLTFGYLDNDRDRYRYQSAEFQFIGPDELTQFEETWYTYLFSRLRRPKNASSALSRVPLRMRGATNPGGVGHKWVKKRFITADTAVGLFVPSKLDDNPYIDHESYRTSLAKLDPTTRAQLEQGLWIEDTSGLVYSQFSRARHSRPLSDEKLDRHILAIDFGVVDATAFVVVGWRKHERVAWAIHSEAHTGMIPSEAGERASELCRLFPVDRIVGDTGGLGLAFAEEMRRRFGLAILPAIKTDKLGHIKLMNGAFATDTLLLAAGRTDDLATELEDLAWSNADHTKEAPGLPNHRCFAAGTMVETADGARPIECIARGQLIHTSVGERRVLAQCMSGTEPTYRVDLADGTSLIATADHPVFTLNRGTVRVDALVYGDRLWSWQLQRLLSGMASSLGDTRTPGMRLTDAISFVREWATCIGWSGPQLTARYRRAITSTIGTETLGIIRSAISSACPPGGIFASTLELQRREQGPGGQFLQPLQRRQSGIGRTPGANGIASTPSERSHVGISSDASFVMENSYQRTEWPMCAVRNALPSSGAIQESTTNIGHARSAAAHSSATSTCRSDSAHARVLRVTRTGCVEPVYNLTVADAHEYFAGGVLVSNCDALLYGWRAAYAWAEGPAPDAGPAYGTREWYAEKQRKEFEADVLESLEVGRDKWEGIDER